MRVRRLGWAGLEIDAGGKRLVVDYFQLRKSDAGASGSGVSADKFFDGYGV